VTNTDPHPTRPSSETRDTERDDARVRSGPDDMPTPEEEEAAERAGAATPEVSQAYEEATERGARQEGEGRIP
jgi:hypothetical protein